MKKSNIDPKLARAKAELSELKKENKKLSKKLEKSKEKTARLQKELKKKKAFGKQH